MLVQSLLLNPAHCDHEVSVFELVLGLDILVCHAGVEPVIQTFFLAHFFTRFLVAWSLSAVTTSSNKLSISVMAVFALLPK